MILDSEPDYPPYRGNLLLVRKYQKQVHDVNCRVLSVLRTPWFAMQLPLFEHVSVESDVFFSPWIGLVWWGLERSAHRCQQGLLWDDTSCSDLPKSFAKLLVIKRCWKNNLPKLQICVEKMKLMGFTKGWGDGAWGRFRNEALMSGGFYEVIDSRQKTSGNIKQLFTSWIDGVLVTASSDQVRYQMPMGVVSIPSPLFHAQVTWPYRLGDLPTFGMRIISQMRTLRRKLRLICWVLIFFCDVRSILCRLATLEPTWTNNSSTHGIFRDLS